MIVSQQPVEEAELLPLLRPKGKRQEITPPLISPNGRRIKQVKCSDKRSPVQASTQAEYEKYGEDFGMTIESDYPLKTD